MELDAWIQEHLPAEARQRIPVNAVPTEANDAPVQRGDWIQVRGHGLCSVTRVHVHRKSLRVDVERARDLQKRSFDLGRVQWRKVEG